MKKMMIVLAIMIGLLVGGCVTTRSLYQTSGNLLTNEQITLINNHYKDIKLGMTKEEVIGLIGEPTFSQPWGGNLREGWCIGYEELWTYRSGLIGDSERPLRFLFDENGKLIELGQSLLR